MADPAIGETCMGFGPVSVSDTPRTIALCNVTNGRLDWKREIAFPDWGREKFETGSGYPGGSER
jgi:hypothetical protein